MPWVRFDDQFPIHRKVDGLSDAAFRLHVSAVFWCARNLTDGFVSEEDLDGVSARVRTPSRFAAECVRRRVWHDAKDECPSEKCPASAGNSYPQGWIIHDYWEYQPSKEQVLKDRQASADRQAKWRQSHGNGGSPRNGSSNGVTNAVSASSPSRPAPKEAGRAAPAPGAPDGRAIPPGPPPGGRQDGKSVAEALAVGVNGHPRPSPDAYERGPELARRLLAEARKPP